MTLTRDAVRGDTALPPDLLCLCVERIRPHEAWAFAQFLKRAGWDHYRAVALSADEAYAMQALAERLRQAFAEQGYAPR